MALYFGDQDAAGIGWPLAVNMLKTTFAIGGTLLVVSFAGPLWLFIASVAVGPVICGLAMSTSRARADWGSAWAPKL